MTHGYPRLTVVLAFLLAMGTSATALGAPPEAAQSQGPDQRETIELKSGDVVTGETVDARGLSEALQESYTESVHFLAKFSTLPDSAARRELARDGLRLVQYVGDDTYIAATTGSGIAQLENTPGLSIAIPLSAEDKIAPDLAAGNIGSWARTDRGKAVLTIVGHADTNIRDLEALVVANRGRLVSSVPLIPSVTGIFDPAVTESLASADFVQWVDVVDLPLEDHNDGVVPALNTPPIYAAPYGGGTGLDGTGVTVLVYDSGTLDGAHLDFSGRVLELDGDATETVRDHSTHVAGTVGGDGANSNGNDSAGNPNGGTANQWAGVAPGVSFRSFGSSGSTDVLYNSPGDINVDFTTAITNGTDLATMSQGNNVVRNGFPCAQLGDYTTTAILLDNIVRGSINNQQLIYFESAGNERGGGAPCGTYGSISSPATAKNTIVVGALNSNDNTMTNFSSWGPTDDGRLSPDVTGPGCQSNGDGTVTSTGIGDAVALGGNGDGNLDAGETQNLYVGKCGTSMATPAVAGVGALLVEQWRTTRGAASRPLAHTMMAIMAHTATDLGNAGPDYQFGYGQVDAQVAADLIIADDTEDRIHVNSVDQGDTINYTFVSDGSSAPRVTMAWSDPPAAALAATTLINDVDLRLIDPDGVVFQPYVLSAANPANVATTGNDNVNNSEMVDGVAKAGTWVVTVTGTGVPSGPQQYTLITPEDATEDNLPPFADANGPYVVDEGSTVALDATGSTDPDGDAMTYAWDFDADGAFDDAIGATPIFGPLGDNDLVTVEVRVTDQNGAFDDATAIVAVLNVPPIVLIDGGQTTTVDEGDVLDVLARFSDPGWLDTYSADIDWGTGDSDPGTVVVTVSGPPEDMGTVTGSHQYGDNGIFTVTVTVTDDDGGAGSDAFALTVDNVDPTAAIDESGTVLINGIPTFLASAGDPIDFEGRSTDPGSDDLDLSWDWDDGPPAPDVTTTYLVNPPATDPVLSPTVQPRDVTDAKTHAFDQACMYDIGFDALDDDGGTGTDNASVLIVGNADLVRSAGYWYQQYRQGPAQMIDDVTLGCYLEIVDFVSDVFDEETDTSTIQKARNVLKKTNPMESALDRQLLAALLNFANGAIGLDELVDTDFDGVADTVFYDALMAAETVRLDVGATTFELEAQKDMIESINLMDS